MKNRENFVEFCLEKNFLISSLILQEYHNNIIIFRNMQINIFISPFTNTRFSQIDHILSKCRWRNLIRNINRIHHISFELNYKIIIINFIIKFKK